MSQKLEDLVNRLEKVALKLESQGGSSNTGGSSKQQHQETQQETSESVVALEDIISTVVKTFVDGCSRLGGDCEALGGLVSETFEELKKVVCTASKSKIPSKDEDRMKVVSGVFNSVKKINDLKNSKRSSAFFNHLSALAEGIQMVQFIESKTTKSYVAEMQDAATFYLNKILVANKNEGDKGKPHLEFVSNFKQIGERMQNYVKEFHLTGLTWNPKGEDALKVLNSPPTTSSTKSVSGGGDIPPPPPVDHEKLRKLQEDAVKKKIQKLLILVLYLVKLIQLMVKVKKHF